MNTQYLDSLAENKELLPLVRDNAYSFVDKLGLFFRGRNVDYYVRYMESNPIRNVKSWKDAERIKIESAEFDLDDVYIRHEKDDIFIDISRNTKAAYKFMPEIGLYLHWENNIHGMDHLLLTRKNKKFR